MGRYTEGGLGRDLLAGAVAGVAAIWIADKLDWSMYRSGGPGRIRQTEAARPGGMDPAHAIAAKAADAVGVDLGDRKDNPAGHAVHYAMAAGMGALYGALRGLSPAVTTGRGALFGVAMFILQDEVANTVLGTGGSPLDYPVRDHARGAAAHTLFGVITDLGTRILAPWRDEVVIEVGPPLSERIEHGRQYAARLTDQARASLPDLSAAELARAGRPYLEQGRRVLEQGLEYAAELAGQARSTAKPYVRQGREYAEQGRDYAADLAEQARAGAKPYVKQGRRYAGQGRDYAADLAEQAQASAKPYMKQGRRYAGQGREYAADLAEQARAQAAELDGSGLVGAARRWLRRLA